MKGYYRILGVPETASLDEIKAAFRAIAKRCHPDLPDSSSAEHEHFLEAREAFEVLSDHQRRADYDKQLAQERRARALAAPSRTDWEVPLHFSTVETRTNTSVFRTQRPQVGYRLALTSQELSAGCRKELVLSYPVLCGQCFGGGRRLASADQPCKRCGGIGQVEREAVVVIDVPPGTKPGNVKPLKEMLTESQQVSAVSSILITFDLSPR